MNQKYIIYPKKPFNQLAPHNNCVSINDTIEVTDEIIATAFSNIIENFERDIIAQLFKSIVVFMPLNLFHMLEDKFDFEYFLSNNNVEFCIQRSAEKLIELIKSYQNQLSIGMHNIKSLTNDEYIDFNLLIVAKNSYKDYLTKLAMNANSRYWATNKFTNTSDQEYIYINVLNYIQCNYYNLVQIEW